MKRSDAHAALTSLPLWGYGSKRNSSMALRSRAVLERRIARLALEDTDFLQEILDDCASALQKFFGVVVTNGTTLRAVQERPGESLFVLPRNPFEDVPEEELSATASLTYEDVARWLTAHPSDAPDATESRCRIIAAAWRDSQFRERLVASPAEAVEEILSTETGCDKSLRVLEETAGTVYIVIPSVTHTDYAALLAARIEDDEWLRVNVNELMPSGNEVGFTKHWDGCTNTESIGVCCRF